MPANLQEEFWAGQEGDAYLERNNTSEHMDVYTARMPFFELFELLPAKDLSILEVGCNCGINLSVLSDLGFTNLSGIDIGGAAIKEAKDRLPNANLSVGSILALPFGNAAFDVVFSSGVLIHQDPSAALFPVLDEMYRCSAKYIIGFEDYSQTVQTNPYCGTSGNFYWRAPYGEYWKDPTYGLRLTDHGFIAAPGNLFQREYYKFIKDD